MSAALQCSRHTHIFKEHSLDNIPNNYQVDEAIGTKYLAQGQKHIGDSRAWTHDLMILNPALFY